MCLGLFASPPPLQAQPRRVLGWTVTTIVAFQWTPGCRHSAMPGPESVLYGVKQNSAVVRRRRLAPGHLGSALGSFSSQS